jgi:hypothetical protein
MYLTIASDREVSCTFQRTIWWPMETDDSGLARQQKGRRSTPTALRTTALRERELIGGRRQHSLLDRTRFRGLVLPYEDSD